MTSSDTKLGGGSVDLSAVSEDIKPDADVTRDLGSDTKRWAYVYAAIAILSSMVIGGLFVDSSGNVLMINGSLQVNGSITALDNITADYYYGDGSKLTGLAGGGDITEVNTPDKYISGGATSGAVTLSFNETALNETIVAYSTDTDTHAAAAGLYLYNDSTTISFNETKLNETIDARDTDTTYSNSSFKTDSIPGNVSCSRINGSVSDLCSLADTDTNTLYYNSSFNIENIPGRVVHNSTTNLTLQDNYFICLGSSGCQDSYIRFNGTTLRIRVN